MEKNENIERQQHMKPFDKALTHAILLEAQKCFAPSTAFAWSTKEPLTCGALHELERAEKLFDVEI